MTITDIDIQTNTSHGQPADFYDVSAKLTRACRVLGLESPQFSTPPAISGVNRTLKRIQSSEIQSSENKFKYQIAVAIDDRLTSDVIADMIDGICHINKIPELEIHELQALLWHAATSAV